MADMKLPDELVERAAKAAWEIWVSVPSLDELDDDEALAHVTEIVGAALETVLSEGGFVTGGVVMVNGNTYPESELHVIVLDKPGRYWVIPLDSRE